MLSSRRTKQVPLSLSAETIACNDDLLIEILHRLPIKSLLKFKSISKHWLSLISNPGFSVLLLPTFKSISGLFLHRSNRFLSYNNPEFELVDLNGPDYAHLRSFPFVQDPSQIKIHQSSHGLLLCSSVCQKKIHIYNPTTQQYTTLPPPRYFDEYSTRGLYLAFDPFKSPFYKVIRIRDSNCTEYPFQIEIYASETQSWKLSGEPFSAPKGIIFVQGVFCNEVIHWVSQSDTSLCFDVGEERLRAMPMPPMPVEEEVWFKYFGESRGHLHLIFSFYLSMTTTFDVYEMARDYSGWFVRYRLDIEEIESSFPDIRGRFPEAPDLVFYEFSILCVVRGESEDGSYMVLHVPGKVVSYNLKNKSVKLLHGFADTEDVGTRRSLKYIWFNAHKYVESLASV